MGIADITGSVRAWLLAPVMNRLTDLEVTMTSSENATRAALVEAISGTLGAYDALAAENDQLRTALESADSDAAARVAAAVAEANEANNALDAEFNAGQVDRLRRFQTAPPVVVDEPAPADGGAVDPV